MTASAIRYQCEQSIEEFRRVFNRKFPDKIQVFERFLVTAISTIKVIPVPKWINH